MRLKNKHIVVTAAAQGIGKSVAVMFAKEGATVIATDINEKKLSELPNDDNRIKTKVLDSTNNMDVDIILFLSLRFSSNNSI